MPTSWKPSSVEEELPPQASEKYLKDLVWTCIKSVKKKKRQQMGLSKMGLTGRERTGPDNGVLSCENTPCSQVEKKIWLDGKREICSRQSCCYKMEHKSLSQQDMGVTGGGVRRAIGGAAGRAHDSRSDPPLDSSLSFSRTWIAITVASRRTRQNRVKHACSTKCSD